MNKYLAATLLATAALIGTASAQTATENKASTADSTKMHKEGEWRASKLVGINVYNEANEKIGDINDVILGKSGRVENVVLGVGGFLGMGEHYVTVAYDKLKWDNEPPRSTTANATTSTSTRAANGESTARTSPDGSARTTGTATTTAEDRKANGYWYPDHAVYNATKDQLKAMPQFKY